MENTISKQIVCGEIIDSETVRVMVGGRMMRRSAVFLIAVLLGAALIVPVSAASLFHWTAAPCLRTARPVVWGLGDSDYRGAGPSPAKR